MVSWKMLQKLCAAGLALSVSACGLLERAACDPHCRPSSRSSSSLVEFLYPKGNEPPQRDAVPELHLPLG